MSSAQDGMESAEQEENALRHQLRTLQCNVQTQLSALEDVERRISALQHTCVRQGERREGELGCMRQKLVALRNDLETLDKEKGCMQDRVMLKEQELKRRRARARQCRIRMAERCARLRTTGLVAASGSAQSLTSESLRAVFDLKADGECSNNATLVTVESEHSLPPDTEPMMLTETVRPVVQPRSPAVAACNTTAARQKLLARYAACALGVHIQRQPQQQCCAAH